MIDWRTTAAAQRWLAYLGLDLKNPRITREELVRAIQDRAAGWDVPLFAATVPAGSLNYDTRVLYQADQAETERFIIRFNEPVLWIGVFFEITYYAFTLPVTEEAPDQPRTPELKDLDVRIDSNREQEYLTARLDAPSSIGPNGYSPCSTCDIRAPRYFMKILPDINGELGFTFRGRYAAGSTSGFPNDILISTTCLAKPLIDYARH